MDRDPLPAFRARLRELRSSVGDPSYDELGVHASHLGLELPKSTIGDLLNGRRVPRWKTVAAFVRACERHAGQSKATMKPPAASFDLSRWRIVFDQAPGVSIQDGKRAGSFRVVPHQLPVARVHSGVVG